MKIKIPAIIKQHKIITAIIVIVIGGGGYYYFGSNKSSAAPPAYVIGKVEKGAIITSVSGTGQVTATNQLDLKPQISAKILTVNVKAGQNVKTGDVLATLDSKDLQKSLKDAKASYDSAVASYNLKMAGPTSQDAAVALKSVQSAKLSYDQSQTNLANAKTTADQNLAKTQSSLTKAQADYDNAVATQGITGVSKNSDLDNAYVDAKTTINSVYSAVRSSLVLMDGILGMNDYNNISNTYKNSLGAVNPQTLVTAQNSYEAARNSFNKFQADYNVNANNWTDSQIEALLSDSTAVLQNARKMDQDVYTVLINSVISADLPEATLTSLKTSVTSQESSATSNISAAQTALQSIASAKLSQTSSDISQSGSVGSAKTALDTAKSNLTQAQSDNAKNIQSAQADVATKKLSYESQKASYDLKMAAPRPVDIASYKIQITQARNGYQTALENLKEATITSPIDGVVAKVYQNPGDLSSLSQSTPLVTIVTNKQMATVSLNEVDAAKVKTGQKATLTFNAIDGLEITGSVVEVDGVGTVTSGVVNYSVQIALDTQDARIKPEMSVSASITTDQKLDALLVPNTAIKTDTNGLSYVEILKGATEVSGSSGITTSDTPEIKYVQAGLSNDANTEITEGLSEGDLIITKTITGTAAKTTTSGQQSGFGILGGGGSNVRMTR
ncbi:MAG: biotin/lipoyl-binding protein [Patescibacteria group bacterium]|jgi:RND family efflux transporter MFP subunit